MEIDPLPEDIRQFLRKHFHNVKDELPEGNFYVFSMKLTTGEIRELKVHRSIFTFSSLVPDYLRNHDIAGQLQRGNVEITKPLRNEAGSAATQMA